MTGSAAARARRAGKREDGAEGERPAPRDGARARDLDDLDEEEADERAEAEDLPHEGGVLRRRRLLPRAHPLLGQLQRRRVEGRNVSRERDEEAARRFARPVRPRLEDDARVAPGLAVLAARGDARPARGVLAERLQDLHGLCPCGVFVGRAAGLGLGERPLERRRPSPCARPRRRSSRARRARARISRARPVRAGWTSPTSSGTAARRARGASARPRPTRRRG